MTEDIHRDSPEREWDSIADPEHDHAHVLKSLLFFFFIHTATTEIYTLSLHDALPISLASSPSVFTRRFCSSNFCGQTTWHWIQSALNWRCSAKPNPHASYTACTSVPQRASLVAQCKNASFLKRCGGLGLAPPSCTTTT